MTTAAGARTCEVILDAAESLILRQGYAATSVEQIIDNVGMTKGAFFHHFRTKNDLARALLDRYAVADAALLRENVSRASILSDDPLQQVLVFIGLFLEIAERIEEPHPGCLFASYCYESGLFDDSIHDVVAGAMLAWREAFGGLLRGAASRYPPRAEVDIDALADALTVIFEGSFIMSRALRSPRIFAAQLRIYRSHIELLFGS